MTSLNKLKKQAGIEDNPDQEGLDLFAQLIVEECSIAYHSTRLVETPIKQHFLNHLGIK
jgi:hypothetical protein